ncbi:hypothetical protein SASPL_133308 [Salvia splendens]|uniref:Prokaryotic-type class I peptide chain release factors domain-containing protein n=1 Tax=Salvia splendens TaxID=180675 RepID=A0A8X8ZI75_SALSN|nr:hypothetical protein SASPL_133308 [Salvia splendens]
MAALLRARDGKAILAPSIRLLRTTLTPLDCGGAQRRASTKSFKSSPRLVEVQRLLYQAEERYKPSGGVEPIPRVTLVNGSKISCLRKQAKTTRKNHVKISYANSGGGGQGFNKAVNTKVDMRFNVKTAQWLDEKVRERIMQMEKHRINKDGEIVISSKKSKAQKSNAEDAIAKLQVFSYQKKKLQAIIDAASYAPVPPSKETLKKIAELFFCGNFWVHSCRGKTSREGESPIAKETALKSKQESAVGVSVAFLLKLGKQSTAVAIILK